MANWMCGWCEKEFTRDKAGNRPIRFCSQPCYHEWNRTSGRVGGRFAAGIVPWNKGKNVRLSPLTEFKKGVDPINKVPVGTVRSRLARRDGKMRAFVKVGEPNIWKHRCVLVWEESNGNVPKGFIVHHRDRDTMNDSLPNLELMSRADHMNEHRIELNAARVKKNGH